MNIATLFTDIFWATAQQMATIVMPIIILVIIMKIIYTVIIRGSD